MLVLAATISLQASTKAAESLTKASQQQLSAVRDTKKSQIEEYFNLLHKQAITLAANETVVHALQAFSANFDSMQSDIPASNIDIALKNYYDNEFGKQYQNLNDGHKVDTAKLLNSLDSSSKAAQYHYIANSPEALGNKHELLFAHDGSAYSESHQRFHNYFKLYLEAIEYYDIFIIDSQSNKIVYSVFKELDYGTSLTTGAYAKSGIGRAYKKAQELNKGETVIEDFERYRPSYDAAAAFIASPIFNKNERLGTIIFQMPVGKINNVMTSNKQWKSSGLGDSGETYIVGNDYKARSDSRFLIEDPK